jgi:hypothetical protein
MTLTWFEQIVLFMNENYQPQEASKLKEEAEANVERLRKQAAGRIPLRMTPDEEIALREEQRRKAEKLAEIDWITLLLGKK